MDSNAKRLRDNLRRSQRRPVMEGLESRHLLATDLIISEVMASNETTLETRVRGSVEDRFAAGTSFTPDWFEIRNHSDQPVDLTGAFLTDDRRDLTKWQLPAGTRVAANGFLTVFASGLDVSASDLDENGYLHTNFQLGSDGEYLALVRPNRIVWDEMQFPEQFGDVSFGVTADARTGYLATPSVGAENVSEVIPVGPPQIVMHEILPPAGVVDVPLVASSDTAAYHVPGAVNGPAMELDWIAPQYIMGSHGETWSNGVGGFGFDDDGNFAGHFSTDLETEMQGRSPSVYLRYQFDVAGLESLLGLQLRMKYDDGFVAYLNGKRILTANTAIAANQPTDPLSLFPFDETSGEVAIDSIGDHDDAILHGFAGDVAQWVPGQIGGAVELDGETHWLSAPTPIADGATSMTFSGWVWADELVNSGTIVKNWGSTLPGQFHLGTQGIARSDGDLSNWFTDRRRVREGKGNPLPTGAWQHVAVTYDGQFEKLFRNGQLVDSKETVTVLTQSSPFVGIGARLNNDGTALHNAPGFWNGKFDDFAFWSEALSDEQIELIYKQGLAGQGVKSGAANQLQWNSHSSSERADAKATSEEVFDLAGFLDLLKPTGNVFALHALNRSASDPDLLAVPELVGLTGSDDLGPVRVTSAVSSSVGSIEQITLNYRFMFQPETSIAMVDDGTGADLSAQDGVYSALIPGGFARPGEMIRYYVTAETDAGISSRSPRYLDREGIRQSPQYFGTVVADAALETQLPVLHRFLEDPGDAETATGTRATVFYDGEMYDNVFVRIRGGTARSWPKKAYKIEFNDAHSFRIRDDLPRVDEINVNTTYTDKSYVRAVLAYELQRDAGQPSPEQFLVRMHQNGDFFSVAILVEQPDEDFLRRHDLDPNGAFYKGTARGAWFDGSTSGFDKKTREHEDQSDLKELMAGLALRGPELERFLFDNVNVPAIVNFRATVAITQNIDATGKNFYVHRDTNQTGEWMFTPWDIDLTFGPDALNTDFIVADENTRGAVNPNAVHPFLGSRSVHLHGGVAYNRLQDAITSNPRTRDMLVRRIRTLADDFLGSAYFPDRIEQLVEQIQPDVELDQQSWDQNAHFGGRLFTLAEATDKIRNDFLPRRFRYLTEYNVTNGVGIPLAQAAAPEISIRHVEFAPVSNNQDEEYVLLENPNGTSVDVSGWQLAGGGINHMFAAGTVIEAGGQLYVSPHVPSFRARQAGPQGNQALFVQGAYDGRLVNSGGRLLLSDVDGTPIAGQTFIGTAPSLVESLRISEVHYHPSNATADEIASGFESADDFEFIELVNIGNQPIDLRSAKLVRVELDGNEQGVSFDFSESAVTDLAAGAHVVVVEDMLAFTGRYGTEIPTAGQWSGQLSNAGETITLNVGDQVIQQFSYDDAWHPATDGGGHSLEIVDARNPNLTRWSTAAGWRPSGAVGGTPGRLAGPEMAGDIDGDGTIDELDIDLLATAIRLGDTELRFDLNSDETVDHHDREFLIRDILRAQPGDANLDGVFDFGDLLFALQIGEYDDGITGNSGWAAGDWNGDGEFDSRDLVTAFTEGHFDSGARRAQSDVAAAVDHVHGQDDDKSGSAFVA